LEIFESRRAPEIAMTLLEAIGAMTLLVLSVLGVARVADNAESKHIHETDFYREEDQWKKWNSPGFETR